uniref:Uncharacterized protein n=1 Tax=Megaviridae environmental sample TaxID=1737588 RepID=A0A5J6VKK5_9VIRU|nr:MAG: hypothetical protein [Megaviridae environmental sample]
MTKIYSSQDNKWYTYEPNKNVVYLIGHGFNGNKEILENLGFKVYMLYLSDYDKYPDNWQNNKWYTETLCPKNYKNLASLVDNIIMTDFYDLIRYNEGPGIVITGSRGGQITLSRFLKYWRGPSICLNGGCIADISITDAPIAMLTGGNDYFRSKDLDYTIQRFSDWKDRLHIYHNHQDDHSLPSYNEGVVHLINKLLYTSFDVRLGNDVVTYDQPKKT